MNLPEWLRAAFVVGRRDYQATVFSKTFLFFLLGPLFPLGIGILFGNMGEQFAQNDMQNDVAVIMDAGDHQRLEAARETLAPLSPSLGFIALDHQPPEADIDAQRQRLLDDEEAGYLGVLEGSIDAPRLTGAVNADGRTVGQMTAFIDQARRAATGGTPAPGAPLDVQLLDQSGSSIAQARTLTARAGQLLLFVLTILLASMLLSQMLEEKSNKAIEVLASSVPVDSVFIGKLFAMLAISLTGLVAWIGAGIGAFFVFTDGGLAALPPAPAVGWPFFIVLCVVYFVMTYLLIGAAFLGVGAQASTVREVQTLSMPVTMAQVVLLIAAQPGIGKPDSWEAIAAAIFPLTSPFAMIARAAEVSTIWTHLAAIAWQIIWVAIILKFAAKLFRKSVLKSGKPFRWPWQRASA